jgi:hypothetical protein
MQVTRWLDGAYLLSSTHQLNRCFDCTITWQPYALARRRRRGVRGGGTRAHQPRGSLLVVPVRKTARFGAGDDAGRGGVHVRVGLALFTLFRPELRLWVATLHVMVQSATRVDDSQYSPCNHSDTPGSD